MLKFSTILRLASFWHSCLARKARQGLVTLRESWMSFANFFNLWHLQRTSVIPSKKSIILRRAVVVIYSKFGE